MYDSLYELYGDNILFCLRFAASRLRYRLFDCRFHLNIRGSGMLDVFDEAIEAQLVHCIFHWWCRPYFSRVDDDTVNHQYSIG